MILDELARETALLMSSFSKSHEEKQYIITSQDSVKRKIDYDDIENDFMQSNYYGSLDIAGK